MHILDFHAPDCVHGWSAIDDRVMGGVSTSQLVFHPDGHAVFTGVVSTDRGGGFASVRHPALSFTRDIGPYLVDRYSERKESAEELARRVNLPKAT